MTQQQVGPRRSGVPALALAGVFMVACAPAQDGGEPVPDAMPTERVTPAFHHIHINAVDPSASIDWWQTFWPTGEATTVAGFPAFGDDGVYLLYSQVDTPAPGGFDKDQHRSVPQSAFWTTGPDTDGAALYERLTALDPEKRRFDFLPVYVGPDDTEGVPHSGLAPYGDRLLTVAELRELAGTPPVRSENSQDFGYLVDPDGVLVEFNGNESTEEVFYAHTHFWHEQPLCAVDWYVEHLGVERLAPVPDGPCDVAIGPVSFPTFFPGGQLRQPIGVVRASNGVLAWYTRQCRLGRCGEGEDRPLVSSRGQVVDHVGFTYPDLEPVISHLEASGIPIVAGPYPFGDGRAIMIADLDGLGLELIELP